jgi:inhibitor of KinA sporulation pathway (predicted exonuclease)
MKISFDTINVVDIEATCWRGKPPEGMTEEIIEVGICEVSVKSKKIKEKESIIIKPERSIISEFCTKLTGLTQEQVDKGISYYEACARVTVNYSAMRRIWVSWGEYDRLMFLRRPSTYPFSDSHINLKNWFSLAHGLSKSMGLYGALNYLKIEPEGKHHSGADDAVNTAKILITLLGEKTEEPRINPMINGD